MKLKRFALLAGASFAVLGKAGAQSLQNPFTLYYCPTDRQNGGAVDYEFTLKKTGEAGDGGSVTSIIFDVQGSVVFTYSEGLENWIGEPPYPFQNITIVNGAQIGHKIHNGKWTPYGVGDFLRWTGTANNIVEDGSLSWFFHADLPGPGAQYNPGHDPTQFPGEMMAHQAILYCAPSSAPSLAPSRHPSASIAPSSSPSTSAPSSAPSDSPSLSPSASVNPTSGPVFTLFYCPIEPQGGGSVDYEFTLKQTGESGGNSAEIKTIIFDLHGSIAPPNADGLDNWIGNPPVPFASITYVDTLFFKGNKNRWGTWTSKGVGDFLYWTGTATNAIAGGDLYWYYASYNNGATGEIHQAILHCDHSNPPSFAPSSSSSPTTVQNVWEEVFFEDFENGLGVFSGGGEGAEISENVAQNSTKSLRLRADGSLSKATSNQFTVTGSNQLQVSFYYQSKNYEDGLDFVLEQKAKPEGPSDAAWEEVRKWVFGDDDFPSNNQWYEARTVVALDDAIDIVKIRFRCEGADNIDDDKLFVDDVKVEKRFSLENAEYIDV